MRRSPPCYKPAVTSSDDDEPTDLELLRRWADGDKQAGTLLYRRHFKALYGYCRRRFANQQLVDDVVQESFMRVLEKASGFRAQSSFRTYLIGTAYNVYREQLRKMRERPIDGSRESLAEISGRRYSSILAHKDELRRVFDALRTIPINDQELLELFHFQDFRVKDLAELLELKENTVKSRLRLARAKLARKYLELSGAPPDREVDDAQIEAWLEAARPDALRAEANEDDDDKDDD